MASRRRTRGKQKAPHWSDSSEGVSTDEDANVQVPKASTSTARGKQKGVVKSSGVRIAKRGKLRLISEMPLDVLYEIFSFLTPRDLVRVSWTNKEFRRVLTSRSARNIWRAALESVEGLPPCPAHMNEIEYSTVLFHIACHGCGRARPPVNWCFRRRICKKCLPDQVYTPEQMWDEVLESDIQDALGEVRLGSSFELGNFLGNDLMKVERGVKTFVTLRDDVHNFVDACEKMLDAGKDLYSVVTEYGAKGKARQAHIKAIAPWEKGQAHDREDTLDYERNRRYQQILERLEDEGWGKEIRDYPQAYDGLRNQPGVGMSKGLTDKGWENIRDSLIAFLVSKKEFRLELQRLDRQMARSRTLGEVVSAFHQSTMTPQDFFPTLGGITSIPHIGQILGHGDDEAFEELKNGITEQLPGLAEKIRKEREDTLLKLLPPGYTSPEPLKLATTWFKGPFVDEAGRVGDAINEMWNYSKKEVWDSIGVAAGIPWGSITPMIVFKDDVMAAVTKLITDLEIGDPEKVTAEELDNASCRVVMFSEGPGKPALNMEIGSWRHLVQKVSSEGLKATNWRVLGDDELPDVTPLAQSWVCAHCWRVEGIFNPEEPSEVRMHLLAAHKVKKPTKDTDYWLDTANVGVSFGRPLEKQNQHPSSAVTTPEA